MRLKKEDAGVRAKAAVSSMRAWSRSRYFHANMWSVGEVAACITDLLHLAKAAGADPANVADKALITQSLESSQEFEDEMKTVPM